MIDPLYVVARAALLDALDAIGERDAVVLVGAQAIYLHTGDADIAVPAFTTDGDLATRAHPQRAPRDRSATSAQSARPPRSGRTGRWRPDPRSRR